MNKKSSAKVDLNQDIDFLYEIGTLRYIQRTWRQFLNPDFQNLAEHHLRVIWIALILAEREKIADKEKVIKLALVHDIAESRTGDVNYLQRQYVERLEQKGLTDMLASTSLTAEFTALWREYEQRQSIEAKIVKDADNLDVDFELMEQRSRGHDFGDQWAIMRRRVAETKLYTKSAKAMWDALMNSHPHAWHQKTNNRFHAGDWKKSDDNPII